jgi:hypothetical protein
MLVDGSFANSRKKFHDVCVVTVGEYPSLRESFSKQLLRPEHPLLLPCPIGISHQAMDKEDAIISKLFFV